MKEIKDQKDIYDICLEDIYINILEDKQLIQPPGAGLYFKFKMIKEYILQNYPIILEETDSEEEEEIENQEDNNQVQG